MKPPLDSKTLELKGHLTHTPALMAPNPSQMKISLVPQKKLILCSTICSPL